MVPRSGLTLRALFIGFLLVVVIGNVVLRNVSSRLALIGVI